MLENNTISIQSKILIFLLISSFILMCLLGFQAFYSVAQKQELARKVLADYAGLAAHEFSRRIMADVGYRSYFKTLTDWNKKVTADQVDFSLSADENQLCTNENGIAGLYFILSKQDRSISTLNCSNTSKIDSIISKLKGFNLTILEDKPFALLHTEENNIAISIVFSQTKNFITGFLVNREQLVKLLITSLNRLPLLPEALTHGKNITDIISLGMTDHLQHPLIELKPSDNVLLTVDELLADQYSGIFKDHKVTVAVQKDSAELLIIGGMPGDNLSTIQVIIFIIFVIFIISLRQLRKERQTNQLREHFVAEVSHELRTPLTQIRMFSEMLLKGRVRNDQEKKDYLEIINRETLRLNHLITNLLKYSENGAEKQKKLVMQPIEPIIINVVDEFIPIATEKNITFKLDLDEISLTTDKFNLQRIILNLLDNAVKYGPDMQIINIQLEQTEHSIRLLINDQGPGIPVQHQQKIWSAYYRLEREHKAAKSGTGIGLFLVRKLVQQIGANISMKNIPNGGSSFIIEWDIEKTS